ncbi:unnamed protein product [Polarella glacialis]|uniref:Tc1-like transposase DDE domain-containing protein n=1 Tax=Polarella glacialis TaxID=89957 RepID=A0A813F5S0_POLGL|nr:unnamed protein product [Polarella glacialis]
MPVISEVVHPLSLNFENQRKVILLRDVKKQSWDDVRKQVRNLKGKKPTVKLLRRVYKNNTKKKGRVVYKYKKCGRKPWKVTKGVESFLLRRLKALRCESICTTTVLQRELVNEKGVDLEASTIRKVLTRNGYFWLTRAQKRKYSPDAVLRMSKAQLRERLSLSLDGVVLSMAPKDPLERQNWCAHGDTHMWRKRCEAASPDLAGNDAYGKQVPLCISEGGFATVVFHKSKKLCTVEWADIVNGGKLTNAIRSLSPTKPRGPWWVLCDNETFLRTAVSQAAHKAQGISLWSVPPRSPDLNPVEKFWAWLRRTLRQKDWADLRAGRKALDKKAYQARVRSTCRTKRAQAVAASCAGGLRKVCKEGVAKKGAMRILRSLMAVSPLQRAKRAFVIVLQSIAAAYSVQLDVTRESADNLVTSAFRRVAKKVHPDKGGKLVDSQRLLAARQLWEDALRAASANGRPVSGKSSATSSSQFSLSWAAESRREFRIQSEAALLTYQGFNGLDHWRRLVSFVGSSFKRWRVKHWCATLETNTDGTDHAHLMLQFTQVVDRTTRSFMFEGLRPNVATTDLGGEGAQCLAGNYGPVWSTEPFRYQVLGAWPEKLWKQRKLSHEVCRNYLFLTRDGVCFHKRNLEAAREHELGLAEDAEIEATTKRLRSNPSLYKAFPQVPVASQWVESFKKDSLRYAILVVMGPSFSGKTEWASSLFKNPLELKVGTLPHFPDKMRLFDRNKHDAIILADIRDMAFLGDHQEKLQGKYNAKVEFASTLGGTCAYSKYLFQVPIVATVNFSTKNLDFLETHDEEDEGEDEDEDEDEDEVVHPLSPNFENQRKVILLRDVKKQSWDDVRKQVRNLKGKKPTVKLLRRVYKNFSKKKGRVVYKYKKCGRKPWKVTKGVESFLLRRLKALRCESICTTTVLQREIVNEKGVDLEASTIRKVLTRNGYFWLTRAQKRKYSPDVTAQRLAFAKAVLRISSAQGALAASPDLAGNDAYGNQVPLCRAVPLWAGISEGGFATVVFHKSKKLCTVEWADIVNGGKLTNAIRSLSPTKPRGPWWVLCDNETFLRTAVSQAAHKAQGISLWSVPPRSPDLNPVEKFWAWLRRTLRQKGWADLRAGRKALDKKAYQARVRSTCRTKRAQTVAASCAGGLRKVCKEVVAKKGAMARS